MSVNKLIAACEYATSRKDIAEVYFTHSGSPGAAASEACGDLNNLGWTGDDGTGNTGNTGAGNTGNTGAGNSGTAGPAPSPTPGLIQTG